MKMCRENKLSAKFPDGENRLINGHEGVVWVPSENRFAIVLIRGGDSCDPTLYKEDETYFEYGCDKAFWLCSSLASITIPNSVTSIGRRAFLECKSLASVTLSNNIISIEDRVFGECENLTSIIIPNGVTQIGEFAFYECSSLESMVIPDSVINIGNHAFCGCENLTIYTYNNSYAYKFAQESRYKLEVI